MEHITLASCVMIQTVTLSASPQAEGSGNATVYQLSLAVLLWQGSPSAQHLNLDQPSRGDGTPQPALSHPKLVYWMSVYRLAQSLATQVQLTNA